MEPFALTYASPVPAEEFTAFRYDPARQLNILPTGRPAIHDAGIAARTGMTTSTAGSKVHKDDTEDSW